MRRGLAVRATVAAALLLVAVPGPVSARMPRCAGERATIVGSDRTETLRGTPGRDVIVGLDGNDYIRSGDGRDLVCGGPGNDVLLGGKGLDRLKGGSGDDVVIAGRGVDRLAGGADSDRLVGGRGNDDLDGGEGVDIADYSQASAAVAANLAAGTATGDGSDSLAGIENLRGSAFGDVLIGDAGPNRLLGGGGDDSLSGGDGDDYLSGGDGDDDLTGGNGNDVLAGFAGRDSLDGGPGEDTLSGGEGADICTSGETQSGCESESDVFVWAAEFMAWGATPSREESVRQAESFDYIAATRYMYRAHADAMKASNPDLTLLVYAHGTFVGGLDVYPDAWYSYDAQGRKIRSTEFGNYLMDPSNPNWIKEVGDQCDSLVATSGYHGCFIDVLGTAPLEPGYTTSLPINPATDEVWTKMDWLDATEHIAEVVTQRLAPKPVFGNGLSDGTKYFRVEAPTKRILDGLDGGMAELFVRPPNAPITAYKGEWEWKQDVDMLVDAAARGEIVLTTTKVWTDGTQYQKDAWHRYALATFLLGYTPGLTYFTFRYDRSLTFVHPYWDTGVGTPVRAYANVGGVYQRQFTNGKVVLNPTTTGVTLDLGGSYRTLQGNVVTSLWLAPHSGNVLTFA